MMLEKGRSWNSLKAGAPRMRMDQVSSGFDTFVQMTIEGGEYAHRSQFPERDLQADLRKHLRSRGLDVIEGNKVNGGETDLVLPGKLVAENKKLDRVANLFERGEHFAAQAKQYSIGLCTSVFFTMVAYRPKSKGALLPQSRSIQVKPVYEKNGESADPGAALSK